MSAATGPTTTGADADTRLARLSLNTATTKRWTLAEAVDGAVRAGIPAVGLWRDRVAEIGVDRAAALVHDAGLRVSSLCRGGFLTAVDDDGARAALADNRAAIEEAAALGPTDLVLVVGGIGGGGPDTGTASSVLPGTDLAGARERVADRLAALVPYALEHGVRLVIEPLHPMYAADRAVVSTLGQALDLAEPFPTQAVGVLVDAFHVWWDPQLAQQVARAGREGRLAGYQVCDWVLPIASDALLSRGMMGDGFIDFAALGSMVAAAGYEGDVEVEIFNADIWAQDGDAVLATTVRRYLELVQPALDGPAAQ